MSTELTLLERVEPDRMKETFARITAIQKLLSALLVRDQDFGTVPGVQRPTLLLPGAQKVCVALGLTPSYSVLDRTIDPVGNLVVFSVRCTLVRDGEIVAEGMGACTSHEPKYRFAWVSEDEARAMGVEPGTAPTRRDERGLRVRVARDAALEFVNPILKIAVKRSLVAAVLQVSALATMFTQDIEDMSTFIASETPAVVADAPADGAFRLEFGKHRGRSLAEVAASDRPYVVWLADKATNPLVREQARRFLTEPKTTKHALSAAKPLAKPVVRSTEPTGEAAA